MGLALGMALKFYASVTKGLKLKVRKVLRLISAFVEVTREKLVEGGGYFWHPKSSIGLMNLEYQLNAFRI